MNTARNGFRQSTRVVWAIAAKDILDALKNKAILTNIATVTFLMIFYRMMPILSSSYPPGLALYDAGESRIVDQLEDSEEVELREMPSQQALEQNIGSRSVAVLGLALPSDFDQMVEADSQMELQGYVDHWISDSKTEELQTHFENLFSELTGRVTSIQIESETIYTNPDGMQALIVSLSIVVTLFLFGVNVTPTLMFEEKETRTLDTLLVSPATGGQVVLGKALAGMLYCLTTAALVLAFNAHLITRWALAIPAVVSGALFLVSVGLLLGSLIKNKQQQLWVLVLAQPLLIPVGLAILGNALPTGVHTALSGIPTVAVAKILRLATSGGAIGLADVGPELALIVGSSALILAVVAWLVRRSDR
jgi:ABC-2 type transport system permease protein